MATPNPRRRTAQAAFSNRQDGAAYEAKVAFQPISPRRHIVGRSTDEPSNLESLHGRFDSPPLNLVWSRSMNFSVLCLILEHAGHPTRARRYGTPSSLGPLLSRQISDGEGLAAPKLAPGLVRSASAFCLHDRADVLGQCDHPCR